jgi:hypothetical protein
MCHLEYPSDHNEINLLLEFQRIADDRSALEDQLSECDPKYVHIYRSFLQQMNNKTMSKGLAAYTDMIGSHWAAYRFQDFEDLSTTMLDLQQDLTDIQHAAKDVSLQLKSAIESKNETDIRRARDLDVAMHQQLAYSYETIIRKERELLELFWKGKRPPYIRISSQ